MVVIDTETRTASAKQADFTKTQFPFLVITNTKETSSHPESAQHKLQDNETELWALSKRQKF